jgi:hypothetical protein
MTKKDLYKNKEFSPFKTEREEKGGLGKIKT